MEPILPTKDELKRKILLVPCSDKESLHRWVKVFLNLNLPNCIIDPTSTSSPADMLWYAYESMMSGDPERSRLLFYAARDCFKTILSSIIELLAILHLKRNVGHMAAIETQSKVCAKYLKRYANLPYIREYVSMMNERRVEFTRYEGCGEVLTPSRYNALTEFEKNNYREITNFVQVVIATLSGANGLHAQLLCVDGDTRLLTHSRTKYKNINRLRVPITARGVFNRFAGRTPSGRVAQTPEVIENSSVNVEVLTVNMDTAALEYKKIVRASRQKQRTIKIVVDGGRFIICTLDHPIYVLGKGFVQAKDIVVGDKTLHIGRVKTFEPLIRKDKFIELDKYKENKEINRWEQVLLGSLLGDCGIYQRGTSNPYISERHCLEQSEYFSWKRSILSEKLRFAKQESAVSGYSGEPQDSWYSGNSPILLPYVNIRNDLVGIEKLDALGLAVWYMDDGCASSHGMRISTEGWDYEHNVMLMNFLNEKFGISTQVMPYSKTLEDGSIKTYYCLSGGVEAKRRLVDIVKPYIHPQMMYKFDVSKNIGNCRVCGKEFWFYNTSKVNKVCDSVMCAAVDGANARYNIAQVVDIQNMGSRWVYDFTVEGNNNFVSTGFLSKNCLDELDIAPRIPVEESKMICAQEEGEEGKPAVTIMTSSRKFAAGLVQEEIDAAEERGTRVFHWNIIDCSRACPPTRHLPDEPLVDIYFSDDNLKAISLEQWKVLSFEQQEKYQCRKGYAGCLKNCRIFAACQGRLATLQKSNSILLKSIPHVQNQFRSVDLEYAKAQLLCRKPSAYGLIYPNFNPDVHKLTARQMVEKITGEDFKDMPVEIASKLFNKKYLIEVFQKLGATFYSGMDHGFTHNFSVVTGAKYGHMFYVLDVISAPELELAQKIEICKDRLSVMNPIIYADPEDPSSNKTLKRHFRLKDWSKTPGSVIGGITIVRFKLMPTMSDEPELFFLKDDDGCEQLCKDFSKYRWVLDKNSGKPTDVPDEEDDDRLDSLRYVIMNVFPAKSKKPGVEEQAAAPKENPVVSGIYTQNNWMIQKITENLGGSEQDISIVRKRKGSFFFDM